MNNASTFRPTLSGMLTAAALALATVALPASADDVKFKLSGDQEVPPVMSSGSGSGTFSVKPDKSLSGSVTTTGIAGTMAHIHVGKAGANGPVAIMLNKTGDNTWTVPDGTKLSDAHYQAYKAGEFYVNVHSDANKPGELRGQVTPPAAAPMKSGY